MAITSTCNIPPQIIQYFKRSLLTEVNFEKNLTWASVRFLAIRDKARRKYKEGSRQDKEMNEMYEKYRNLYERQEAKKENYEAALKKAKEKPVIPNAGATCRFKRMES